MHTLHRSTFLASTFTKCNNCPSSILKKYQNNLVNISKFTNFSLDIPNEIHKHNEFELKFDPNKEKETQSILLDPQGPYAESPKYKRAPAPKGANFKRLTQLEKCVFTNPYVSIIGSPIRQCIYHQRWFPQAFLVRFIRAYDSETSSVWIVPDFMEEGGTRRPGKGYWVRCNAKILQNFFKEGKHKSIDYKAYWREDMHEHIWKILVEDSILRIDRIIERFDTIKFPMKKEEVFLPIIKKYDRYYVDYHKPISGLQCVLMLDDPPDEMIEEELDDDSDYKKNSKKLKKSRDSYIPLKIPLNHICSLRKVIYKNSNDYVTQTIPLYYVKTIWGDEGIRKIKECVQLKKDQNMIGIIYMPQTKQLAVSLWKLRNFWQ
ncbi:hypothetical protein GLOIN_2v1526560 [Rhizophagus clarus]|nr:hypothetical protein GLOIN_2v1526560 [Rhizophagus clarus]